MLLQKKKLLQKTICSDGTRSGAMLAGERLSRMYLVSQMGSHLNPEFVEPQKLSGSGSTDMRG